MTSDRPTLAALVAADALDAELAALLWLLAEGGLPLIVTGRVGSELRADLAAGILSAVPERGWVLLDADTVLPDTEHLSALVRSGQSVVLSLASADLRSLLDRLARAPDSLPEDAVRRLGVVLVCDALDDRLRLSAAHYLRATERDAQGHVQRRPPAVLAVWDPRADVYEHFAWGITPELADRVNRSQADLETRQRERARFLVHLAHDPSYDDASWHEVLAEFLAAEPPRVPAPPPVPARPSPLPPGLTDPAGGSHVH